MNQSATGVVELPTPRWLHAWAVLTVLVTLPLLTLGAEVTSKGVGMVDRQPVRSPLYLVELLWEAGGWERLVQETNLGLVIEHSHRTVGWIVGMAAIVLCAGLAFGDTRRWMRWMGLAALAGVTWQGVLGILRVHLQAQYGPAVGSTVALIHGSTAQIVLGLLVSIAVWTSATWTRMAPLDVADRVKCRRATLALAGVMFVQMYCGALIRHKEMVLGMRLHILLAFAVVAVAAWAGSVVLRAHLAGRTGTRVVAILAVLVAVQVALGLETLLSKFMVRWPATQERVEPLAVVPELIRSAHFLVGALTFVTAVSLVLLAHRDCAWPRRRAAAPVRQLEGAL
jgi:heme a synthase